ncbi:TonB-dependent receptor [Porifericola rhodea]|uniref:SusC/RagA family TonB-linked outer membrane protein n=1 Tax=Porifericola rhodea TaxID=930972 RepID=UPI002666B0E2|nr:TonB-dependent receptor [Porifericola rhodea]WKN30936.1 TonB-dependent receptor [Porifericola rhodea]
MRYTLCAFLFLSIVGAFTYAEGSHYEQDGIDDVFISIRLEGSSVEEVFKAIEEKTEYVFAYGDDVRAIPVKFSLDHQKASVSSILREVSQKARLNFKRINSTISVTIAEKGTKVPWIEEVQVINVTGQVFDEETQEVLPGVNVLVKNTSNGTITDIEGRYKISVPQGSDTLMFSYIGYRHQMIAVNGRTEINVNLQADIQSLSEVIVVGYGTQKKESVTGAISTVSSQDIERVRGGATVSSNLAGKLPGVSFRMPDGRPGAAATVQIRNMGDPLFVIDGIQQDSRQFNNLSPNDIESITILKDGSAAIYGVRAANGVVLVTTKKGKRGEQSTINLDAYQGFQNWYKFMDVTNNSYDWAWEKVQADINGFGETNLTREDLQKYKEGVEPGYQSFNWKDFIIQKNAPISQVNLNVTGGSEKINYYVAGTRLDQSSVLGREFTFGRTNLISNLEARVTDGIKLGMGINGYIEETENPGIPGGDDYWLPRYAILRNTPWERPYANDNPEYLNDIKHNETNWAYNNFELGGYSRDIRKYLQANLTGEWDLPFIEGLQLRGLYSYGIEDRVKDGHEYTYEAYTYYPATEDSPEEYRVTGGSTNPWRERLTQKIEKNNGQLGLHYSNIFGEHEVGGLLVAERYETRDREVFVHSVPATNVLPLIYFNTTDTYNDRDYEEARIGYIARINYNFANKYYIEVSGRRDASWKFAPENRVGYFPSASIGWRITQEKFMQSLLGSDAVLSDLKLRASYGILGDDNVGIGPYDYLPGYNYNQGIGILDGNPIIGTRDKGQPITNITWFKSKILDVGADFSLFNGKLSGSIDYFNRKRTGLRGRKSDIVVPQELGYSLPDENVNSDKQFGGEISLIYSGNAGNFSYNLGGNLGYARSKFVSSYNPIFFNSWDRYRYSGEDRFQNLTWAYQVIGQFQSQEEINNYPVNIDGQGNKTLLPGDLIYKDLNGDNKIDGYDERPIGYGTNLPIVNGGLNFLLKWKGFDFAIDFSIASMYSYTAENELSRAFRANGGNMAEHLRDAWHRVDPFDINSEWVAGKFPPNRFNQGGLSSVNKRSDFWMTNITTFRARTIQLGYNLPDFLIKKIKLQQARIYLNGYNLFSIDNLDYPIDPEIRDTNGLQYPQNRIINVGINLTI